MEDLRTAIGAFIAERDWDQFHSPKNLAMALSVEVAEIVEHFQWLTEEQSRSLPPETRAELEEEIGDVLIYLTELAEKLGIDPVEAAKAKLEINNRKYPANLVRGKFEVYGVRVDEHPTVNTSEVCLYSEDALGFFDGACSLSNPSDISATHPHHLTIRKSTLTRSVAARWNGVEDVLCAPLDNVMRCYPISSSMSWS